MLNAQVGGSWGKGKFRLSLAFKPDEPETNDSYQAE